MSTWSDLKNNPRLKKIYETRLALIRLMREFFWSEEFVEAETPLAVRYPGQEPYLNPMPLTLHEPNGAGHQFYLHTSPEFSLKKLLAAGFSKIFEITKTFRDYESFGGHHNPEFTMAEWYRAPGTLNEIMNDVEKMFKYIGRALGQAAVQYHGRAIPIAETWERKSMKELWQKYLRVNLDECLTLENIGALARASGHEISPDFTYEDIFFKIFLNEIEPRLGLERPLFVYDYPAQMCSLSRASADPRYAERSELYIGGLELCNGFGELTDADEQLKRLEQDRQLREKLGKPTWNVDPDFISALAALGAEARSAKAAGVALGVDRMVLLFTGANDINEVIFNSAHDQLES